MHRRPPDRAEGKKTAKKSEISKKTVAIIKTVWYNSTVAPIKACKNTYAKEVQNSMAKCEICGKGVSFGIKVSHSHRRSNRMWKPNVRRVKAIVNGTPKRVYACTRCLRSGKVERA